MQTLIARLRGGGSAALEVRNAQGTIWDLFGPKATYWNCTLQPSEVRDLMQPITLSIMLGDGTLQVRTCACQAIMS